VGEGEGTEGNVCLSAVNSNDAFTSRAALHLSATTWRLEGSRSSLWTNRIIGRNPFEIFWSFYLPPLWILYKYLRADSPEMPLRNWYNCGTKHFHMTSVVSWKLKNQLDWVIKPLPYDLVRRMRFWRIKIDGMKFKYLYWTISKIIPGNLFTYKGTYMIGSGRTDLIEHHGRGIRWRMVRVHLLIIC